jgi:hypothetical protein
VHVTYRSISKGTALAESFGTSGNNETLTVAYPDHDTLMLMHYCAQGNQARLTATEVTDHRIAFRLVEATNVQPGQAILDRLVFEWHGDTLDKTEIYKQSNGTFETTVLHFVRAPKAETPPTPSVAPTPSATTAAAPGATASPAPTGASSGAPTGAPGGKPPAKKPGGRPEDRTQPI